MSRSGFGSVARTVVRAAAQAERARIRQVKEQGRYARAQEREARRSHALSRAQEVDDLNAEVAETIAAIDTFLAKAVQTNTRLTPASLYTSPARSIAEPNPSDYLPQKLGFFGRLFPGSRAQHALLMHDGERALKEARHKVHATNAKSLADASAANARIDDAFARCAAGEHDFVCWFYETAISRSLSADCDATSAAVGYSADSKQLVVDLELPAIDVIPEIATYRYIKSADRIDQTLRPIAKRKAIYGHLITQVVLKCLDVIFRAGQNMTVVTSVTLNGMLDAVDPTTGRQVRACLISVRVTRDVFDGLNLAQVSPEQCLKALKASVSRAPSELVAVKPILELEMVDPRFVETQDVLTQLESRPNLMDLTPGEFEGLITNLFASMGLDTKQTRASRDGGVDCVAFDPRPIFGGKVVIQAKRYKHTVGVSAVRDLFGTVQNEGASKGILVTTSGFGAASFDFAKGKPLELLDGGNLLYLLSQHAGIEARIIMPENWIDAPIHGT